MAASNAGLPDDDRQDIDASGKSSIVLTAEYLRVLSCFSGRQTTLDVASDARAAQHMSTSPVIVPVIEYKLGEATVVLDILTELSEHRKPPLRVCGKNLEGRPTIHVTLTAPVGDLEAVRTEYKDGGAMTIKERRNRETDHFAFEWVAPR